MANLTVWKFYDVECAGSALNRLAELRKQPVVELSDAAVVTGLQGRKRPVTRQAVDSAGRGVVEGAYAGAKMELINSNLCSEQEAELSGVFGGMEEQGR